MASEGGVSRGEFNVVKTDVAGLKDDVCILKEDVAVLKDDVRILKDDVHVLKEDVCILKDDVHVLKEDVKQLKSDVKLILSILSGVAHTGVLVPAPAAGVVEEGKEIHMYLNAFAAKRIRGKRILCVLVIARRPHRHPKHE